MNRIAALAILGTLALSACEGDDFRGTQPTGSADETQENVLPPPTYEENKERKGLGPLEERSVTGDPVMPAGEPARPQRDASPADTMER